MALELESNGHAQEDLSQACPEYWAWKLYQEIIKSEPPKKAKQILDLYADCLMAVRNPERRRDID